MCRDAELTAHRVRRPRARQHRHRRPTPGASPGSRCSPRRRCTRSPRPRTATELKVTWERGLRRLLDEAEPGSDSQLTFARQYAAAARTEEALADLEALLDGTLVIEGLDVDTDLRWALLTGLAAAGRADDARIDAELASDNTISGQEHAAFARAAAMPTPEAKEVAWRRAVLDPTTPNETARQITYSFMRSDQDEVLAPYVQRYLDAVETSWETLGPHKAAVALEYIFPKPLASAELLATVDAWLETATANPGALRFVREGRADVARALAAQAKDAEDAWLRCEPPAPEPDTS